MPVDENAWRLFQQHLGYSDKEMALFRANPRNAEVVAKAPELMQKTIMPSRRGRVLASRDLVDPVGRALCRPGRVGRLSGSAPRQETHLSRHLMILAERTCLARLAAAFP